MGDPVDTAQQLLEAAGALRDRYEDSHPVSTSALVNPLLDLWAIAIECGPTVAGPIEELLTLYNGPRDLAMPSELAELVDTLRERLDPAMV
ncbi:MAG TPA: hypothetical protein VFH45_00515 [Acidimicrobiales bacterium]|nr:hypothetical protein [Acidimicrobiales bacterium]